MAEAHAHFALLAAAARSAFVDGIIQINVRQDCLVLQRTLEYVENFLRERQTPKSIKALGLQDLRKKARNTASGVNRYLNLGWIGVCEIFCERNWGMGNVMEIRDKFHSFLLRLQYLFLKCELILTLWERMLYLVLFMLSFSEFPNKRRSLCTTMPLTNIQQTPQSTTRAGQIYNEFSWNWGGSGRAANG